MTQTMIAAATLGEFRIKAQEMFDDGWGWVAGGGSIAYQPKRPEKMVGGFWGVVEKEFIVEMPECSCGDKTVTVLGDES